MSNIRLISSTTIHPSSYLDADDDDHNHRETQHHHDDRLELITCDLLHLVFIPMQGGLLFHKPKPHFSFHDDDLSLVDHLKAALSRTLRIFYPLAGCLAVVENDRDGTASYSIDCGGGGGALFVHAAAEGVSVGDILNQVNVPKDLIRSFFTMNGTFNYQAVSEPLLAVQVTELTDGIFIACTMNHVAADGASFWHFFNTWSHISRTLAGCGSGVETPPPPVFDRRGFFGGVFNLPLRVPFSYQKLSEIASRPKVFPTLLRFFHFSKATIAQLKVKANAGDTATVISTLKALMAHLWVSVTRSRGLRGDEEVTYWIMVGLRQRLEPPLPEEYFGNAVRTVVVRATAGELLDPSGGFGLAARLINEAVASQTAAEARKYLEEWARQPVLVGGADPPRNFVATGGSPRYDLFGNDFGWGAPAAMRNGEGCIDGSLLPVPGAEKGSVDFEVCLSPEAMHALAQDPDFLGNLV